MTSQKSSANKSAAKFDFKNSFKGILFPSICSFIVSALMFIVLPVTNIFSYVTETEKGFDHIVQQIREYLVSFMSFNSIYRSSVLAGIVLFCIGVLFALFSFRFLMKKQSVNFYFSSSIDRKTLFNNRIFSSVIMIAATIFVPVLIDAILNLVFFGHAKYILSYAGALFFVSFVYAFTGFAMMSVSMTLCHTIVESLIFGAAFAWAPTVFYECIGSLCRVFLRGYSNISSEDVSRTILNRTSIGNPLFFGRNLGETALSDNIFTFVNRVNNQEMMDNYYANLGGADYEKVTSGYYIPAIIWFAVSAVFIFIAQRVLIKRKMENADMHGKSPLASGFFVCEAAIVLGVFSIEFSSSMPLPSKFIPVLIGIAVVAVVSYLLYSICTRRLKHSKKMLIIPAVSVASIGIAAVILSTGCFGYTTYVPQVDEIEYAIITNYATDVLGAQNKNMQDKENYNSLYPTYNQDILGVFTEKEDLQKFTDIAKLAADKTDDMNGISVGIQYKLKNGKVVARSFDNTDADFEYNLLSLTDTKAYRKQLDYLLSTKNKNAESSDITEICENSVFVWNVTDRGSNTLFHADKAKLIMPDGITNMEIDLTDELTQAILDDRLAMDYKACFDPAEKPIGMITFENTDYSDAESKDEEVYWDYSYINAAHPTFCLFDSMKNTVAYLKSAGLYDKLKSFDTANGLVKATVIKQSDARQNCFDIGMGGPSSTTKMFATSHQTEKFRKENTAFYEDPDVNNIAIPFAGGQEITDPAKLGEIEANSSIFGWTADNDYLVLLEYKNGDRFTRILHEEQAKGIVG